VLKSVKPNLRDFKQLVDVRLILPGGDIGWFEICDAGSTDWQGNRCNLRNTAACGPEGLKMCLVRGSVWGKERRSFFHGREVPYLANLFMDLLFQIGLQKSWKELQTVAAVTRKSTWKITGRTPKILRKDTGKTPTGYRSVALIPCWNLCINLKK
jgi:hypothetical protein